jgi:hypothetical protein
MKFRAMLVAVAATLSACSGERSPVWWSSWRPSDDYVTKVDSALERFQADPRFRSRAFAPRQAYHRLYYGTVEHGEPMVHVLLSVQRVQPQMPNTHYRSPNMAPPSSDSCSRYTATYRLIDDSVIQEACLSSRPAG